MVNVEKLMFTVQKRNVSTFLNCLLTNLTLVEKEDQGGQMQKATMSYLNMGDWLKEMMSKDKLYHFGAQA